VSLTCFVVAALSLGSEVWPHPLPPAPLVGFSYSPMTSQWMQRDPANDLRLLLSATSPDLVRLPIYWDVTQPTPTSLDFSQIDQLLSVVALHNLQSSRPTALILTIGARNFLYPELHAPSWAGPREQPALGVAQSGAAYRTYFDATLLRYRSSSLLYSWQVENEPFDFVGNASTGDDLISASQLAWELGEVHRLDPKHPAVVTSFDGWNAMVDWLQVNATGVLAALHGYPSGHPEAALEASDVLGLDLYVDGPIAPLLRFTSIALRNAWKEEAVHFWAERAVAQNKQTWLMEVQAQPWETSTSFTPADLLDSAVDYRQEPVRVVLLWGVETWLRDPVWMSAAVHALAILREE
jgi:hypothetical protein